MIDFDEIMWIVWWTKDHVHPMPMNWKVTLIQINIIFYCGFYQSKIFLLDSLPDAVATDCSKCSPKQRDGSMIVTHYLIDNHPDEWERLEKVYDKNGDFKKRYLASKNDDDNSNTAEPDHQEWIGDIELATDFGFI